VAEEEENKKEEAEEEEKEEEEKEKACVIVFMSEAHYESAMRPNVIVGLVLRPRQAGSAVERAQHAAHVDGGQGEGEGEGDESGLY
jgi:hypothetical protein